LHGAASGQIFADTLRVATQRYFGTPIWALLPEITAHAERIADAARRARDEFSTQNLPTGAGEQVGRAAARFGLVAAGGELASALGITGWEAGAATEAAGVCFAAWLERRGHVGSAEAEAGIEQVRHFFALHGASRFGIAESPDTDAHGRVVFNRAGFRKDGNFWVYPEVFRSEIAAGYDWRGLANTLAERGLLKRDNSGKVQCLVREPNGGRPIRMLCFSAAIVGEEAVDDEDN
jgi:putative DNA primase/helicase